MTATAHSPRVYLASASPRRRELLTQLGVPFAILPVTVEETPGPAEDATMLVTRLALEKARAGLAGRPGGRLPVLAADTAVTEGGALFGKPADRADARRMHRRLAGRTHEVLTAVALADGSRERLAVSRSEVIFRSMSDGEIDAYWDSGEPADKAGGYAIQGLGAIFVAGLNGSYSGVMGLPLFETARLLEEFGIPVLAAAVTSDPS